MGLGVFAWIGTAHPTADPRTTEARGRDRSVPTAGWTDPARARVRSSSLRMERPSLRDRQDQRIPDREAAWVGLREPHERRQALGRLEVEGQAEQTERGDAALSAMRNKFGGHVEPKSEK